MTKQETELQMVLRHIAEAERHVSAQLDIIAQLRGHRYPTDLAEQLLTNLEDLLVLHRQHLERLRSHPRL